MMRLQICLFILLLIQTFWAPTCGGGPTGSQYDFGDPNNLGLPYPVDPEVTIDIIDLDGNSSISSGNGYRCPSPNRCHTYGGIYRKPNGTEVLLTIHHEDSTAEFQAELRYAGNSGMDFCGGPKYRIENIERVGGIPSWILASLLFVLAGMIAMGAILLRKLTERC